jgi:RHS repeat-associated protein
MRLKSCFIGIITMLCWCLKSTLSAQVNYVTPWTNSNLPTVPDIAKVVGEIAGNDMSGNGSSAYKFDLETPPGTNGMEPELTIVYSSGGGNGNFGLGFSCPVGGVISRTASSKYLEGSASPVSYNFNNDQFTIDGQRLLKGRATTIGAITETIFETEHKNFLVIKSYATTGSIEPQYFKVYLPDGTVKEYGTVTNARINNNGHTNQTLHWHLNKVTDASGNYMDYVYSQYSNLDKSFRLEEIRYTGNTSINLLPYNKVKFNYAKRADVNSIFYAGIEIVNDMLVISMQIYGESNYLIRTYNFQYSFGDLVSQLATIGVQTNSGSQYNTTKLTYDLPNNDFAIFSSGQDLTPELRKLRTGDYDGDGILDFSAHLLDDAGSGDYKVNYYARSVSNSCSLLNSYAVPVNPVGSTYCWNGSFWNNLLVNMHVARDQIWKKERRTRIALPVSFMGSDFDGDNKSEDFSFMLMPHDCNSRAQMALYGLDSSLRMFKPKIIQPNSMMIQDLDRPAESQWTGSTPNPNLNSIKTDGRQISVHGDFDDDSKLDWLVVAYKETDKLNFNKQFTLYLSSKSFAPVPLFAMGSSGKNQFWHGAGTLHAEMHAVDTDGDGKAELCTIEGNKAVIFQVQLDATGDYFIDLFNNFKVFTLPPKCEMHIADYNGDGLTDFGFMERGDEVSPLPCSNWQLNPAKHVYELSKITVYYSTGLGFKIVATSLPLTLHTLLAYYSNWGQVLVGDYNGDGRADIAYDLEYASACPSAAVTFKIDKRQLIVYFSTGMNFLEGIVHALPMRNYVQYDAENEAVVADFNGDSRMDIGYYSLQAGYTAYRLNYISFGAQKNCRVLKQIQGGMCNAVSYHYKLLNQGAPFYTSSNLQNFPYNTLNPPLYALESIVGPDGVGGTSTKKFEYEDLILHRAGKGLMGYKKVRAISVNNQSLTEVQFAVDPTYAVPYAQTISSYVAGALQSSTTNQYIFAQPDASVHSKQYVQLLQSSNTYDYDFLCNNSIVYEYDNGGPVTDANATKVTTSKGSSKEVEVTQTTYTNVAGYLFKNRPVKIISVKSRNNANPVSKTTSFSYSAPSGYLLTTIDFDGEPLSTTSTYAYTSCGKLASKTLTAAAMPSLTESYTYDPKYRFTTSTTNAHGTVAILYVTQSGKPAASASITGETLLMTYDDFGNLLSTLNYTRNTTEAFSRSWAINTVSNALYKEEQTSSEQPEATIYYDKLSRQIRTEHEGFNGQIAITDMQYNNLGQNFKTSYPHLASEPISWVTRHFDLYGRQTLETSWQGNVATDYLYSLNQLITTITAQDGTISKTWTDACGRKEKAKEGSSTAVSYTYDGAGNLLRASIGGFILIDNSYDQYCKLVGTKTHDIGRITYAHNAYGERTQQKDASGNTTDITYNNNRTVASKQITDGTTTHVVEYAYVSAGVAKGKIASVSSFDGVQEVYDYDPTYGDLISTTKTIDGNSYTFAYTNSAAGRLLSKTFPDGLAVNYIYDADGLLLQIENAANSTVFYKTAQVSGRGNITEYKLGNGKVTSRTYNQNLLTRTYTPNVYDYNVSYDASFNISSRYDATTSINETFTYDNQSRLLSATSVTGGVPTIPQTITYATGGTQLGNIMNKNDVGDYKYDYPGKQSAVTDIRNPAATSTSSVAVLPPPQNISSKEQNIKYSLYQRPAYIAEEAANTADMYELYIKYGSALERVKSNLQLNGNTITSRTYLNDYEVQTISATAGTITQHMHYITSPVGLVCILVSDDVTPLQDFYVYEDHLGSIMKVTDAAANIIAHQNFDAWGRQRDPVTLAYNVASPSPSWLYRGYTGQEMLPEFDLINMNARLYDPVLGRMLAPDIMVSNANDADAYNRFTYAHNNPLKYTDPDGNLPVLAIAGIAAGITFVASSINAEMHGWSGSRRSEYVIGNTVTAFAATVIGGAVQAGIMGSYSMYPSMLAGNVVSQAISTIGKYYLAGSITDGNLAFRNGLISSSVGLSAQAFLGGPWGAAISGGISQVVADGLTGGINSISSHRAFASAITSLGFYSLTLGGDWLMYSAAPASRQPFGKLGLLQYSKLTIATQWSRAIQREFYTQIYANGHIGKIAWGKHGSVEPYFTPAGKISRVGYHPHPSGLRKVFSRLLSTQNFSPQDFASYRSVSTNGVVYGTDGTVSSWQLSNAPSDLDIATMNTQINSAESADDIISAYDAVLPYLNSSYTSTMFNLYYYFYEFDFNR